MQTALLTEDRYLQSTENSQNSPVKKPPYYPLPKQDVSTHFANEDTQCTWFQMFHILATGDMQMKATRASTAPLSEWLK